MHNVKNTESRHVNIIRSRYTIPLILFIASFILYSYNLEGQPWHGDEINYLGWAGNYAHLLDKNLGNSCLISIDNCALLFHIPAHGLTYSPLRMLLIGLPLQMNNQDTGDFYNWSCYYFNCYDPQRPPTIEQMATGRMLSPLFGSFTAVLAFFIGKALFNKNIGIVFSLLFFTYDLWIWFSRTIMTEVHYTFFAMLTFLFLLYAFKNGTPKIKYLISSGMVFGLALTSKILSVEFIPLFVTTILFYYIFGQKRNYLSKKKSLVRGSCFACLFLVTAMFSFFLTEPGFYHDPIHEIFMVKSDMDNYNHDVWFIGYPTINGIKADSMISIFHYVLFPSFIEKQLSDTSVNLAGNLTWVTPPTYSTIPMSIFFFIGFGYLVYRIIRLKNISEIILLSWFVSTFIFSLLMVRDFSLERYLLPFMISVILIAAYGLWHFVRNIPCYKSKVFFCAFFIFAHTTTSLSYWQKIYFSPGTTWVNPLHYGTLQESIDNPITLVVNIFFLVLLAFVLVVKIQKRTAASFSNGHLASEGAEEFGHGKCN